MSMSWLQSKAARPVLVVTAVVLAWAAPAEARRARGKRARPAAGQQAGCRDTMNTAELQAQTNHLIDAARLYGTCARKSCGAAVYKHCKLERIRISRGIPSVVLTASEPVGVGPLDVQVTIDGGAIPAPAPGQARLLDPGPHEFVFKAADGRSVSQKVNITAGERRRSIAVVLPVPGKSPTPQPDPVAEVLDRPAVPPPPPPPAVPQMADHDEPRPRAEVKSRSSVGPYLLGGLGLAGLGGYALLTHWGRVDNDNLGECAPRCPEETLRHIRQLYLAADVSAAVGGAALLGSTIWFIARSGSSSREEVAAGRSPYLLDVKPTRSGALATLSGAF
jgi:hypothetical protein